MLNFLLSNKKIATIICICLAAIALLLVVLWPVIYVDHQGRALFSQMMHQEKASREVIKGKIIRKEDITGSDRETNHQFYSRRELENGSIAYYIFLTKNTVIFVPELKENNTVAWRCFSNTPKESPEFCREDIPSEFKQFEKTRK